MSLGADRVHHARWAWWDPIVRGRAGRPPAVLGGILALSLVACEPPDRPPTSAVGLPLAAVAYLDPGSVSTFRLEEGVVYRSVRSRTRPWSVHLLEIDTSRCELGFQVARAEVEDGRSTVTDMARRSGPGVVAAVNGDFFTPEGLPLGLEISSGELRGSRARPVFAWRPGELPWVGVVVSGDDSLRVGRWTVSETTPDPGIQVVSGFPSLLEGGAVVGDLEVGGRPDFAGERHPRTAVGHDPARGRLWLVVLDGRREGASEGMTLPELAGLLGSLGVRDAINLDGGGSSVMVIRGEAVSRPADPAGERSVVNALILLQDEAFCHPSGAGLPEAGRDVPLVEGR